MSVLNLSISLSLVAQATVEMLSSIQIFLDFLWFAPSIACDITALTAFILLLASVVVLTYPFGIIHEEWRPTKQVV